MRAIFWLSLMFLLLLAVIAPILYLVAASDLPSLQSEYDLERHLRARIEAEQMSARRGLSDGNPNLAWQRPQHAKLPPALVSFYLSQWGCPTFFQSPRETSGAWAWRMFSGHVFRRQPAGDGACERAFALQIARELNIDGQLQRTIAAHKIRSFLQKDQLLAYALASHSFDDDVIGVEAAAQAAFRKPLSHLTLSEYAELALTLPPHGYFRELRFCRNAALIRQARDFLLRQVVEDGLIHQEGARLAQAQPVACTQR